MEAADIGFLFEKFDSERGKIIAVAREGSWVIFYECREHSCLKAWGESCEEALKMPRGLIEN